jgi:hypothetical protein
MAKSSTPEDYRKYVAELESLVTEQGWDLKKYPRVANYTAFKPADSGQSAFGIGYRSDNTPYLYIKRVKTEASGFSPKCPAYNEPYDQAEYDLNSGTRLRSFLLLLTFAYERC